MNRDESGFLLAITLVLFIFCVALWANILGMVQ